MIEQCIISHLNDFIIKHSLNIEKLSFNGGAYSFYTYSHNAILSVMGKYYLDGGETVMFTFSDPDLIEKLKQCLLSYKN